MKDVHASEIFHLSSFSLRIIREKNANRDEWHRIACRTITGAPHAGVACGDFGNERQLNDTITRNPKVRHSRLHLWENIQPSRQVLHGAVGGVALIGVQRDTQDRCQESTERPQGDSE